LLFQFLTEYAIKEQGNLGLIHSGLGVRHMNELVNVGLEYLEEELMLDVRAERPWRKSSKAPPDHLDMLMLLFKPNVVLIAGLEKPSQHWMVIREYGKADYVIFDSEGADTMPCKDVAFTRNPASSCEEDYVITASCIFVLRKGRIPRIRRRL